MTLYNENKVINILSTIQETCFTELNPLEKILVISNLLLIESEQYLPKELKADSKKIISDGKRINYESLKYNDNLGLSLATFAHLIVSKMQEDNGDYDE